jgi:hypothetical protein
LASAGLMISSSIVSLAQRIAQPFQHDNPVVGEAA